MPNHREAAGADVLQQGSIDSIGGRVALAEDSGDLPRLPVDDARQDQVQTAASVHLLPQLAGVNLVPPPGEAVPGQGMELLNLERAASDPAGVGRAPPPVPAASGR
jgi:hypothetical protein